MHAQWFDLEGCQAHLVWRLQLKWEGFRIARMFWVRWKICKINNSCKHCWSAKTFEKRQGKLKDISFEFWQVQIGWSTVQARADEACFSEVTEKNVRAVLSIPAPYQHPSWKKARPRKQGGLEETRPRKVVETTLPLEDATDERCTQAEAWNIESVAIETIQWKWLPARMRGGRAGGKRLRLEALDCGVSVTWSAGGAAQKSRLWRQISRESFSEGQDKQKIDLSCR